MRAHFSRANRTVAQAVALPVAAAPAGRQPPPSSSPLAASVPAVADSATRPLRPQLAQLPGRPCTTRSAATCASGGGVITQISLCLLVCLVARAPASITPSPILAYTGEAWPPRKAPRRSLPPHTLRPVCPRRRACWGRVGGRPGWGEGRREEGAAARGRARGVSRRYWPTASSEQHWRRGGGGEGEGGSRAEPLLTNRYQQMGWPLAQRARTYPDRGAAGPGATERHGPPTGGLPLCDTRALRAQARDGQRVGEGLRRDVCMGDIGRGGVLWGKVDVHGERCRGWGHEGLWGTWGGWGGMMGKD